MQLCQGILGVPKFHQAFYVAFIFHFFPFLAEEGHEFLPPVKTPTDVVGLEAASLPAPQSVIALQNISLKHPYIEIQ